MFAPGASAFLMRLINLFTLLRPVPLPLIVALTLVPWLAGCATARNGTQSSARVDAGPLKTVSYVDLARYMGDWRVIANIPYFAEKGCVDSIETYGAREDGRIDNIFTYRKQSFDAPQKQVRAIARVYNKVTNAEWRIRFFGIITAKYLVLDLDPDYQWTVVGHPSRRYGWIMARGKTLPAPIYQGILDRLAAQGYDPKAFVMVPQQREQMP